MSKKQSDSTKLKDVLKEIKFFVAGIQTSLSSTDHSLTIPESDQPVMLFFSSDKGAIQFLGDEVFRYRRCLDALTSVINTDLISRKAIDDRLKEMILDVVVASKHQDRTLFQEILKKALDEFQQYLASKPILWRLYYRVSSLEFPQKGCKIGNVQFVKFNKNHLALYKKKIRQKISDKKLREERLNDIYEMTEEPLLGETVAVLDVYAIDIEAARSYALKELQLTLDVINFYSDIFYSPKQASVSLYGNDGYTVETTPVLVLGEEPRLIQATEAVGRMRRFDLAKLLKEDGKKLGIKRVSKILANKSRNQVENRVLSAIQWAGRATIDTRNEESFLLYAIALECLLMERNNEQELGIRLRQFQENNYPIS